MPIIVEDGTIVADANSLVARAEYITYAASIGITIADGTPADAELIQAMRYIDEQEPRLKGVRVSRDQPVSFPRDGVVIDGWYWSKTEIPRQALLCQMSLALDIHAGIDLYNRPAQDLPVVRERVEGAVDVSYANPAPPMKMSKRSSSTALLNSLMKYSGFTIPVVRG